jgi:hypothetical protein
MVEMTTQEQQFREELEGLSPDQCHPYADSFSKHWDGSYDHTHTQAMWLGYLAGRKKGLEELEEWNKVHGRILAGMNDEKKQLVANYGKELAQAKEEIEKLKLFISEYTDKNENDKLRELVNGFVNCMRDDSIYRGEYAALCEKAKAVCGE